MSESKKYMTKLLLNRGLAAGDINDSQLNTFIAEENITQTVDAIIKLQTDMLNKWDIKNRVHKFTNLLITVPNGSEKVAYNFKLDVAKFTNAEVTHFEFEGLSDIDLNYNAATQTIEGTPAESGDFRVTILFKVKGEDADSSLNRKEISIVVNPDPKSLWHKIESDKDAIYWKEDDKSAFATLNDRSIVVSSKRGRSHQNVGSFRDDDFAFKHLDDSGWTIIAVSDGAGSSPLSRRGSALACNEVVNHFSSLPEAEITALDEQIKVCGTSEDDVAYKVAETAIKQALYKAVLKVHNNIKEEAQKTADEHPEAFETKKLRNKLDYFHATLIFAAIKKFDFGYAILTFGVGDCPIGIMNRDGTKAHLLNWLDVGEFGGGTRFITQPEIFHSEERPMATRFNIHFQDDFSFLFLMTDGIYDPKFVVEANLEKSEKWIEFIADLQGENEDGIAISFDPKNEAVEKQLSEWMDFWSKGNHDDRTLAILF